MTTEEYLDIYYRYLLSKTKTIKLYINDHSKKSSTYANVRNKFPS